MLSCVILFSCFVGYAKHEPGFYGAAIGIVVLYGMYVIPIGLRYRVFYDEAALTMLAAGGQRVIRYEDIAAVRYEIGPSQSRPLRRIVFQSAEGPSKNFIDVSLRHFNLDDIAMLLAAVHERRPDLTLPNNWDPR